MKVPYPTLNFQSFRHRQYDPVCLIKYLPRAFNIMWHVTEKVIRDFSRQKILLWCHPKRTGKHKGNALVTYGVEGRVEQYILYFKINHKLTPVSRCFCLFASLAYFCFKCVVIMQISYRCWQNWFTIYSRNDKINCTVIYRCRLSHAYRGIDHAGIILYR